MWKQRSGLSWVQLSANYRGLYDLHFVTAVSHLDKVLGNVLQAWVALAQDSERMSKFVEYALEWWLPVPGARFSHWQVCYTSRGMTSTNNPVEQYNATLKAVRESAMALR